MQILRDHLIVEIDGETIDSKTIDQIYKKYTQDEDLEKLNKLNFDWDPRSSWWIESYRYLLEYYEEFGNTLVPRGYKTEDGYNLNGWVTRQRQNKENK